MDLGHVVSTLNKLDVADSEESVVLTSRDGRSLLVTTYAEIARCLEDSYAELCVSSVSSDMATAVAMSDYGNNSHRHNRNDRHGSQGW